jgi:hypothetical protein
VSGSDHSPPPTREDVAVCRWTQTAATVVASTLVLDRLTSISAKSTKRNQRCNDEREGEHCVFLRSPPSVGCRDERPDGFRSHRLTQLQEVP